MKLPRIAVIVLLSIIVVSSSACIFGNSFTLEGSSMEPTLYDGQKISSQHVDVDDLDRYDIIVFYHPDYPQDQSRRMVKRIIGLPGEKIECIDAIVYINDAPIDEPYVQGITSTFSAIVLSDDQYFVMGDNRQNSADSRSWGPVEGDDIIGLVQE